MNACFSVKGFDAKSRVLSQRWDPPEFVACDETEIREEHSRIAMNARISPSAVTPLQFSAPFSSS
jgi:hypothetical protein